MAQDIRNIVFSMDEVILALDAYRRMTPRFLPEGRITSASPGDHHALVLSLENLSDGVMMQTPVRLDSLQVLKALIRFCIVNNIMLPRAGEKSFSITHNCATLNIKLDLRTQADTWHGNASAGVARAATYAH